MVTGDISRSGHNDRSRRRIFIPYGFVLRRSTRTRGSVTRSDEVVGDEPTLDSPDSMVGPLRLGPYTEHINLPRIKD